MKDADFTLTNDITIPRGTEIEGLYDSKHPLGYSITFHSETRFVRKNKHSYYFVDQDGYQHPTSIKSELFSYIQEQTTI